MKIAVLSDIHGNMEAFEAVLADIKEEHCSKIYLLGDYAMAGPEPVKTLQKVMDLNKEYDIKIIQGNTDLMIAEYNSEVYENVKKFAPVMAEALKNDFEIINEEQRNFLKNLPAELETTEDGIKILLVHGSPRKNNENIFPNMKTDEIEELIEGVTADIILCGHTHIPCGYQTSNKKTVINDGSVGRPFTENPDACYLIMTIQNGKCLFEHKFIKYNNELASQKMLNRNFEGKEKLAQTLLNPVERHF